MNPETAFYNKIKDHLPGHVQRIESSSGSGIPDVNGCHSGIEYWIELKVDVKRLILLRKEQYAWGMRRALSGGHVMVIALVAETLIQCWKYPLQVIPHGISAKYVEVTSLTDEILHLHDRHRIAQVIFQVLIR